jgi:cell division septum initiation protein DivIVA
MTNKEFKRLSRSQLIDIIYQLQLKQEELTADNERLSKAMADKRLRIGKTGNIAEAALEIHNVMQAAQDAAEHYMEEIQHRVSEEYDRILKEANEKSTEIVEKAQKQADEIGGKAQVKANEIIGKAQQQADEIVAQIKEENPYYDPVVETILKKYSTHQ